GRREPRAVLRGICAGVSASPSRGRDPDLPRGRARAQGLISRLTTARESMASATRTVEEVLRDGGFTAFHRRIVAITGFAWTFVAFEIIIISLVLPVIGSEFGIFSLLTFSPTDPVQYGWVAAATLIGSFIGSLTLGRVADARGRRTVFLVSILLYSIF